VVQDHLVTHPALVPIATRPLSNYLKPIKPQHLVQSLILQLLIHQLLIPLPLIPLHLQPAQEAALPLVLALVLALALALALVQTQAQVLAQVLAQVQDLTGAVVSPLSTLLCK
jgi:hypothetical protein